MKTIFTKGKRVVSKLFGEGVVHSVKRNSVYWPVIIKFNKKHKDLFCLYSDPESLKHRMYGYYTKDGKRVDACIGVNDVISLIKK